MFPCELDPRILSSKELVCQEVVDSWGLLTFKEVVVPLLSCSFKAEKAMVGFLVKDQSLYTILDLTNASVRLRSAFKCQCFARI